MIAPHRENLEGKDYEPHQTGGWRVAELTEPSLAVQRESKEEAIDKLAKRLEEYNDRQDYDDIRIPDHDDPRDDFDYEKDWMEQL